MNCRQLIRGALLACALIYGGTMTAQAAEKKHDHAGHSHDSHDHAKFHDLGTTTVAGLKLKVLQEGEVKAGGDGGFEIALEKGSKKPKAVRVWVGNGTATGSVKTKAEEEEHGYHAHVEVPKELPKGSQLWVEVDPVEGKKAKVAFDLKQ